MKKPNIIFILADQLRSQSLGYFNDKKAWTPNIDQLAEESVNFVNAVSSMPVCSAFRASLFTGKYTTSTGMVINEIRMNPNHKCLAHCLCESGYTTGYIGKWHLWANELGNHNDSRNSYTPPGPYRLGFDGYWAGYNFHHNYYDTYFHTNSPEKIYYGKNIYEPDAQTNMAVEFLKKNKNSDEPFALFLSYGTPHDPWTKENVPAEFYNKFKDTDFPTPINYKQENDEPYGDGWSNIPKSPEKLDEWMRVYYAMTANLDWNVHRILKAMQEYSIDENTILIFASDHGEMFGAHGRMKKNIFYEEAIRVPFLIRWPEKLPAGLALDTCISNIDIMSTLLGMTEINIPEEVEGMDLSHLVFEKKGPEPEFAFLQNTGACAIWDNGHEWRAVRTKQFTYAVYKVDGKELLFDNIKDPYQMKNLVQEKKYQSVLQDLKKKMKRKMASINDTFEDSLWYRDNWISKDREILRSATLP